MLFPFLLIPHTDSSFFQPIIAFLIISTVPPNRQLPVLRRLPNLALSLLASGRRY